MKRRLLPVLLFAAALAGLCAQSRSEDAPFETRGDPAAAEQYLAWAEQAIAQGRWPEALAALERAADFADVSSDLSYLLALARSHEGKSRGAVLEALERALAANRWGRYNASLARLLKAEQLIALRNYSAALVTLAPQTTLAGISESAGAAVLRLAALKGLATGSAAESAAESARTRGETGVFVPPVVEFRRRMLETMDRYPRDPRPLRILFDYARNRTPDESDRNLMELALRRLPFVLETDPDLAWMAAPFIRDIEEARRLVASCRAGGLSPVQNENFRPNPASIPAALNLGLIDDAAAAEELFALPAAGVSPGNGLVIDKDLIAAVSDLLRDDAGRDRFAQKLLAFSGSITVDEDRDGYPESRALYRSGVLQEYFADADQDGVAELVISCNAGGDPERARVMLPNGEAGGSAMILWERYPSALRAELGETVFIFRPGGFQFAPIRFTRLAGSARYAGLPFPLREDSRLTVRTLVSFALRVERPGAEAEGALETIDLDRGIPLRAIETLAGQTVSETEFEQGRPVMQRLDLDLDGRMETIRRFRGLENKGEDPLEYKKMTAFSESDWDGDGIFETAEEYREDGSVLYSWDMDKDGIREYSEIRDK